MSYESAPGMPEEGYRGPAPAATKPSSVSLAEKLMYGGAAITLISGLLSLLLVDRDELRETTRQQMESAGQTFTDADLDAAIQVGTILGIVIAVISAAVWVLMGWLNGKGIGWARIVATILGILGVLLTVVGLFGSALLPGADAGGALSMVLSVITGLIALAVVVLLWRPDASAFFAARNQRR